jgi:hypothetical protein
LELKMAGDQRYNEIVPEPVRRFEQEHFEEPSDWYIRSAANVGIYIDELEEALPSTLLDGPFAEAVLRGEK